MKERSTKAARILMVAPTPFFADRGCHVRILGEAKGLIELGHEVLLCTYGLGRDLPGIRTQRTLRVPWYRKLSPGPSVHKFYIDLLLLWQVIIACLRFRPHVIHAHLHEGIVLGKIASVLFRIPMVADLQGSLTAELVDHAFIPKAPWLLKAMHWIEKKINQMPDHLIASSTHTRQLCLDHFGLPAHKITTLMDGVDLEVFSPGGQGAALRQSLRIRPEEQVVIFIGVLTEYQGIDLLLQAIPAVIRQCPTARFVIVGYPNEDLYRQKAQALGVEKYTLFTGKVPYNETPHYLSLAQIAVSPKISATEANLKLFSYMAMGLPTVVFENPVNREILGDLGIYASLGDAEDLARALITVLGDPAHARRIGELSRQKALQDYSWLAVGHRLVELYEIQMNGTLCADGQTPVGAAIQKNSAADVRR
ncbi:MAG: glycosyltransferase family 4 protein [Caldilineaceae bacterium]|nr:glycosyltransferase family 4 protein [Caldilineaceae bacterium]